MAEPYICPAVLFYNNYWWNDWMYDASLNSQFLSHIFFSVAGILFRAVLLPVFWLSKPDPRSFHWLYIYRLYTHLHIMFLCWGTTTTVSGAFNLWNITVASFKFPFKCGKCGRLHILKGKHHASLLTVQALVFTLFCQCHFVTCQTNEKHKHNHTHIHVLTNLIRAALVWTFEKQLLK